MKYNDNIKLQNFLFVYDSLKGNLPTVLNKTFTYSRDIHDHNTRNSSLNHLTLPKVNTSIYGLKSVIYQAGSFWNNITKSYPEIDFINKPKSFCKKFITKHLIEKYKTLSD